MGNCISGKKDLHEMEQFLLILNDARFDTQRETCKAATDNALKDAESAISEFSKQQRELFVNLLQMLSAIRLTFMCSARLCKSKLDHEKLCSGLTISSMTASLVCTGLRQMGVDRTNLGYKAAVLCEKELSMFSSQCSTAKTYYLKGLDLFPLLFQ